MRSDLVEKIRHQNELARLACEDGNQVWGGWVWTAEPLGGPACRRLCRLDKYREYKENKEK